MEQQKQAEYIKQLASKIDVLTTHNKILETQISQQAISLSTPLGKFLSKNKLSPGEQRNAMISRGGKQLKGPKGLAKMSIYMMEMMKLLKRRCLLLLMISYVMMPLILMSFLITLRKFPQDLMFHLYHSPKEWLRINLTNNLGSFSGSL